MISMKEFCLVIALFSTHVNAFEPAFATRRCAMAMKRGQGSSFKEVGQGSSGKQRSWFPVAGVRSVSDLSQQSSKIQVVDSMLDVLINPQTNPTGAVCLTRYQNQLYCFNSSCPSCKIPLTKAQVMSPERGSKAPRLSCGFCRATFNLSNGERLETPSEGGGLLSGLMKNVFAAKASGPLPIYALGEGKDGQLVISVD
jgi:nitrite reductase/ring-hydroxylating ferredoxin subunit